jgi:hypothetical protein
MIYEVELYSFPDEQFNKSLKRAWSFIKDLYFDVLKKDENFHFFYEEIYTIVRFSYKYKVDFLNYLKQRKIVYSKPKRWIDSSTIVEKYKGEYTKLFHIFSMFAIFVPATGEMNQVFDRIVHPFCNHNFYKMALALGLENDGGVSNYAWEPEFIARNLVDRAMYNGRVHGNKLNELWRAESIKENVSVTEK